MSESLRWWARSAGLIAGPACWALSTQAAYTIATQACQKQSALLAPMMLALIAISAICALVSAISARSAGGDEFAPAGGMVRRFVAVIGFLTGLLFAVVLANQFAAALILQRCLR